MSTFGPEVFATATTQREVELTTYGRTSGEPHKVVIWVSPGKNRLYIRSGGGLGRHWTRNVEARDDGVLHLEGHDVPVRFRHVTDPAEARQVTALVRAKYGQMVKGSTADEPLTPGETATFEILPA